MGSSGVRLFQFVFMVVGTRRRSSNGVGMIQSPKLHTQNHESALAVSCSVVLSVVHRSGNR